MNSSEILVIIPARWASTRFPGKPLHMIAGRPMIAHVLDRAREGLPDARIIVATDNHRIAELAAELDAEACLTRSDHPSGTDRCAEVLEILTQKEGSEFAIVFNLQGDEPLLPPQNLRTLASLMRDNQGAEIGTLACPCPPEEFTVHDVVKVVTRADGRALYFSRAPIPHNREGIPNDLAPKKHIGIYAYRPESLRRLVRLPPSPLELTEKLEQLRALENGMDIVVGEGEPSHGVDTPEQAAIVHSIIASQLNFRVCP